MNANKKLRQVEKRKQIKQMKKEIANKTLNLARSCIVYDELADNIGPECRSKRVSEIVNLLHNKKNTFTRIDFTRNLISDEGLRSLVDELQDHQLLEEINFRDNQISDIGLRQLKPLLSLPNLRILNVSKNYGPSDATIEELTSNDNLDRESLRLKIKY